MKYDGGLKRAFDIAVAGFCTAVLVAPMTLLAIFNAIYLRENPIYIAEREGKDRKPFKMFKLKTMRTLYDENGDMLPEKERTTRYGHLLRYTALDEIPQFINVLLGDMSLVGPRPNWFRKETLDQDELDDIFAVRPGMTGPWQVSVIGTKEVMPEEDRIPLEASYVREGITFKRDMSILVRTPITMIKGHDGLSWLYDQSL